MKPKPQERVLEQTIDRKSYTRKLSLVEKVCLACQQKFWGVKMKRYCSRACQNKADYEKHSEERRTTRVEKYHEEPRASGRK